MVIDLENQNNKISNIEYIPSKNCIYATITTKENLSFRTIIKTFDIINDRQYDVDSYLNALKELENKQK